jgi:hypothetical protein
MSLFLLDFLVHIAFLLIHFHFPVPRRLSLGLSATSVAAVSLYRWR